MFKIVWQIGYINYEDIHCFRDMPEDRFFYDPLMLLIVADSFN